eukprot:Seg1760.1 transcript_id=Seg1760.1/GoldUCD/mRNA.D3Y31 product="F-box only protein 9" protein_id=Seg1760.1/GoldUCD/D3Y31
MENNEKIQLELASFRQQWHDEIQTKQGAQNNDGNQSKNNDPRIVTASGKDETKQDQKRNDSGSNAESNGAEQEREERAAKLFLKGVQMERQKMMYEAIQFYKQAIHLVPDIESRIADYSSKLGDESGSDNEEELSDLEGSYEASASIVEVTKQFKVFGIGGLCIPAVPSRQTHISVLPSELLIFIFRWVVSDELDLRSLEQAAQVCKWFYACARDESMWRSVCLRVWGVNCGSPSNFDECWRRMLLERPHIHFNGVYINKNTYVRSGEQSLDAFYRPFHVVEYFRYIRFYADGSALVCTTAEDPCTVIPTLRRKQETATVIKGHYRLNGDTVTIVTKKLQKNQMETRNRRRVNSPVVQEQTFHMELKLKETGKRKNIKLLWMNYSYVICNKSSGQVYSNQIDIQGYKPFSFSRVKSFHCFAKAPL